MTFSKNAGKSSRISIYSIKLECKLCIKWYKIGIANKGLIQRSWSTKYTSTGTKTGTKLELPASSLLQVFENKVVAGVIQW
jgi:hypothetical protein